MAYLALLLITVALLVGFFMLTLYERGLGARLFTERRELFDRRVGRIEFVLTHVDFGAFAREETRRFASNIGHRVAHFSLQVVRAVERLLTRLVRSLRSQHSVEVRPTGETREFVKTLSDFKDRLKDTMPEVSKSE